MLLFCRQCETYFARYHPSKDLFGEPSECHCPDLPLKQTRLDRCDLSSQVFSRYILCNRCLRCQPITVIISLYETLFRDRDTRMELDPLLVELVIVGAGPVGLWTAIQIKILLPGINVVIHEKYTEYRRKHVLQLAKASMSKAPSEERIQTLISRIPTVVRTSDLETWFRELAENLGISIVFEAVENVEALCSRYPNASMVIGADGSRSLIRRQIMNDKFAVKDDLRYIIELKYEVHGSEARELQFMYEFYATQKLINYIVFEAVGSQKKERPTDTTPVTIRFIVPKDIYMAMQPATFKSPYELPRDCLLIPESLYEAIKIWLNARKYCIGEERVAGSERITALNLTIYQSEAFIKNHNGLIYALVGDAAFGVPFYRALNNGLLSGSKLAFCVRDYLCPHRSALYRNPFKRIKYSDDPINDYNWYVNKLARKEMKIARAKSRYLYAVQLMNRCASTLPWQMVYWDSSKIESFKADPFCMSNGSATFESAQVDSIDLSVDHDWQGPDYDVLNYRLNHEEWTTPSASCLSENEELSDF